jgi:putative Mg2+ transporter-C (MgtC) family protein
VELLSVALGDLHQLVPSPWCEFLNVVGAFLCGAIVGFEREKGHKPAGLRTMILICTGSAVFTVVSLTPALGAKDPARIAAQIVAGVGFLGTGAILRDRLQVTGLTTAATIWTASGIGIVAGVGYVTASLLLSIGVLVILASFRRVETAFLGVCDRTRLAITYHPNKGKTRAQLNGILDEGRGPIQIENDCIRNDGMGEMVIGYCRRHKEHRAFLAEVAKLPHVEGLEPVA